jgi:ATP-dependent helicase/nuclease subunit A
LWAPAKDQEESRTAALAEENKQLLAQEYRRLLYVAMTRAQDRLYIGGWEGKNKLSDDCWYNLIEPAFKEIAETVITTTGESVLRLSNPQEEAPDGKLKTVTSGTGDVFKPPDWALKPAPPEPEPTTPLSPSRFTEDEEPAVRSPFDGDDGARFKRGTVIHRLLEGLPNLAPEEWTEATVRYLARPVHGLDGDQQKAIAEEVLSVMKAPEFKALFGPGSLAEVPINGMIGDHVVSARIDRLAVSDESIIIIDFKTNRPPPLNAKSTPPVYLKQMAIYRALLQKIYPGRKVSCILAWTDTIRLMILPDELLDQYAP